MNPDIKILIIDKEEIIFKSIQKALKYNDELRCNIIFSADAFEGLKYIRNNKFDMVLIDLVLPGMNATELIRRIKNIDSAIPVIIMSGFSQSGIHFNGNSELQDETLKSAAGFLLKPFTTEEIKSLILRTLKKVNPVDRKK